MIDSDRAWLCLGALILIYGAAALKRWWEYRRAQQAEWGREIAAEVRYAVTEAMKGKWRDDPWFGQTIEKVLREAVVPGQEVKVVQIKELMVVRFRVARVKGPCHTCGQEIKGTFGCAACKASGLNYEELASG